VDRVDRLRGPRELERIGHHAAGAGRP
jgi:hypothetical protein